MRRWLRLVSLVSGLLILAGLATPALAQPEKSESIHIFFSAGCADCWPYVEETLTPALLASGITAESVIHDFTRPGGRR